MKHSVQEFPSGIQSYLRSCSCSGYHLIGFNEEKDSSGNICYNVHIVVDDQYSHLRFNGAGELTSEVKEPLFSEGYYEHYY